MEHYGKNYSEGSKGPTNKTRSSHTLLTAQLHQPQSRTIKTHSAVVFLALLGGTSPIQKKHMHAHIYVLVKEVGLFCHTGSKYSLAGITAARWRGLTKRGHFCNTTQVCQHWPGGSRSLLTVVFKNTERCARSWLCGACLEKRTHSCPSASAWSFLTFSDTVQCLQGRYTHHFHGAFHPRDPQLLNWGMDGSCSLVFALCLRKQKYQEPKRLVY